MSNPVQHDYSHYVECSNLIIKYRQNHFTRLVILSVVLLLDIYLQTFFFLLKHSGESMAAVMYANDGKSVSVLKGAFVIAYVPIAFIVGIAVIKFCKKRWIKFAYVGANFVFLMIFTIVNMVSSSRNVQGAGAGVSHLPFGYMILCIFLSLVCITLALLGEHTHPKLFIALNVVIFLAMIAGIFYFVFALFLLGMNLLAVREYTKMQWIMQQPGYPYFNERFDEQQEHHLYEPLHKLDHRRNAEMLDAQEIAPPDHQYQNPSTHAPVNPEAKPEPEMMDYTLKISDDPSEMPGIEDIFKHVEPLPEPELPKAEDIPAPVWEKPAPAPKKAVQTAKKPAAAQTIPDPVSDFPETNWDIPDTKWDMPETNWDVPDVASDIPELPDIPDIPKL